MKTKNKLIKKNSSKEGYVTTSSIYENGWWLEIGE